jgi:hypothetical protein
MGPERNYRDKLFLWSYGFKPGQESQLSVSGRKVADSRAVANISNATNAHASDLGGWTMLVAVEFPEPGCWELTATYLGQTLKFIVEVVADPPRAPGAT